MPEEADLERTDAGLVPASAGWFVVNARDARWIRRAGRGYNVPLTGWTEEEAETLFPELGVNLLRLEAGEPIGMYHWEADAEAFLVLSGAPVLIIDGEERPLRRWDFVHCPPGTEHMIVGAGEESCLLIALGARGHIGEHCNGGEYVADDVAARHGASIEPGEEADPYRRFPPSEPVRYGDGWLPGD